MTTRRYLASRPDLKFIKVQTTQPNRTGHPTQLHFIMVLALSKQNRLTLYVQDYLHISARGLWILRG